ncbi:hypothetical protein EON80_22110, partial [bacterium]
MRLGELLAVNSFPAVIAGSDIAVYRKDPTSPATLDFVSGYLGFDARSHHALHSTLASLARPSSGGAFWFNGVFGSGKSHLLGLLSLLADGIGHEAFAASHPDCAQYLPSFQPRFCLHISLDEFDAAKLGLEEIFWLQMQRSWADRGLGELEVERIGSRVEAFSSLQNLLEQKGLTGLIVC